MNSYMMEDIDLKDFMVVKKEFFAKEKVPIITLGKNFICLNRDSHALLERCETVQFRINMDRRGIIVAPIASSDESAVAWTKGSQISKQLKLYCPQLALRLFKEWKLQQDYQYKIRGELISPEKKIMLHFSLYDADVYDGIKKVDRYNPDTLF